MTGWGSIDYQMFYIIVLKQSAYLQNRHHFVNAGKGEAKKTLDIIRVKICSTLCQ